MRLSNKTILTALTLASGTGVIVTSVLSGKATIKAYDILKQKEDDEKRELTAKEKVKAAAPIYIPVIVVGIVTIGCIIGSGAISRKQQASLVAAYAALGETYKKYRTKVAEEYGAEKDREIVNDIAVEQCKEHSIYAYNGFLAMEHIVDEFNPEKRLWYFSPTGAPDDGIFFESSLENVLAAEYHLNRNFVMGGERSVNDLLDFLGLERINADFGWTMDDGFYWIDFEHPKATIKGRECYIINPIYGPMPYCENIPGYYEEEYAL